VEFSFTSHSTVKPKLPHGKAYIFRVRIMIDVRDMGEIRIYLPDNIHKSLKIRATQEGVGLYEYIIKVLKEAVGE